MASTTRNYRSARRAQDAADTRRDILAAARELFATRGYARVTVADIARQAEVAVQTVYASAGGKSELLTELLTTAVDASGARETLAAMRRETDPRAALAILARGVRLSSEGQADILDVFLNALPVHENAAELWETGSASYRAALREAAVYLDELGAVPEGLSIERATDLLWFHFGFTSWRTLVRDCGWSWDDAERWLAQQAASQFPHSRASAPGG